MHHTRALIVALGAVGCGPSADADVWELGLRLTAPELPGDDAPATIRRARWALDGVRLTACDGASLGWIRGFALDERPRTLTPPRRDPGSGALMPVTSLGVDLPAGAWCRADLAPDGPLEVSLTTPGGAAIVLALDLGVLTFHAADAAGFGVQRGTTDAPEAPVDLIAQLGGLDWLDALNADLSATVKVAPGSPEHDAVRDALLAPPTGLYAAADADAALTDDERAADPVAEPSPPPTETP